MATVLYSYNNGDRIEQIEEATGGAAPTAVVEVNIATGQKVLDVLLALDQIKAKVATSKVFAP